jgi:hypothetical protein
MEYGRNRGVGGRVKMGPPGMLLLAAVMAGGPR